VATSLSPGNTESITYNGSSGYYRWIAYSFSGSGSYTIGISMP
jgi:streptogrisin C